MSSIIRRAAAKLGINAALTLATGFVLFFFSERLFWSTLKPGDSIGELAVTWLAYSVLAYVFLSMIHWFRARSAPAVFLCGAAYGWLAEGTLVGTLYGTEPSAPFPLSVLCTGVSWHALISVAIGWHFLRKSLHERRPWSTFAWAAGAGLFWGTWATFLWHETPPIISSLSQFAAHAFVVTAILIAAYGGIALLGAERFRPRPFGLIIAALALGLFYSEQVKALGVRPLVVLPLLLASIGVVLRRAQRVEADAPPKLVPRTPLLNFAAVLIMPLTATAAYAVLLRTPQWTRVPIAPLVMHWTTPPVGGVLLVAAIVHCLTRRRTTK